MKNIKYVGTSDVRELDVESLERVGGSSKEDLRWDKDTPVHEVTNELAELLTTSPGFFGEFEEVTDKDIKAEEEAAAEAEAEAARLAAGDTTPPPGTGGSAGTKTKPATSTPPA